ncbi:tumor necrosis factor receptor superfamily member 9 [Xenopus laevis]|uniref:TNFR-Cys domain-containing protein n=2 Tax=Xenopus laevis TaxID=8355 RepID=A0A974HCT4_XENLA|nr:tumor necrosis factor receptor superfamily member 9 [Xenopus laevis]OCT72766.1 hypothetical protein XELAEV_18035748mg [Xenopus laevis]
MEIGFWILFLGLLVLMSADADEHYNNGCQKMSRNCCVLCNPGYRLNMVTGCGQCYRCPQGSFMETTNNKSSCQRCKICENVFEYSRKCTPTSNAVCKCTKGKICVGENCEKCAIYECPDGQEIREQKCTDCPSGTFKPGGESKCKPWKICPIGVKVVLNGTRTSDVICGDAVSHTTEPTSTTSNRVTQRPRVVPGDKKIVNVHSVHKNITNEEPGPGPSVNAVVIHVLIFGGVIISLAILFCSLPYIKKWIKKIKQEFKKFPIQPVKTPEQEDPCPFPVKEQGDDEEEEPIFREP